MFWSGYQASPIESLLDKDSYTLEELLDEDDLIQECKSLNQRLIQFLRETSTVEQLLRYIVEPPKSDADANAKRTYKYPFASCEIFCCEVEAIFTTLVEDEHLMDLLFSLLDTEQRPLDAMLAGYFARVVNSLLMRKTADTMAYLERQQKLLLPKLLQHLDTTSVAEILVRVLGADEQTRVLVPASSLQWLLQTDVLDMLLDCLLPEQPVDIQKAAADVLTAIAETQLSPLARNLANAEAMNKLFERAFAVNSSALVPALNVCIALVEPRTGAREAVSPTADEFVDTHIEIRMKTEAVFGLADNVVQLVAFLRDSGASAAPARQETPFGYLQPALGGARLKVVELLAALGRTGMRPAEEALLQHGAIEACLDLFRMYPFNNLLHRHVTSLLSTLLESGADTSLEALLAPPCSLLQWVAALPQRCQPVNDSTSSTAAGFGQGSQLGPEGPAGPPATMVSKSWRPGYMGHVTLLGNRIQHLRGLRPQLQAAADSSVQWKTFVTEYLEKQNALQALDAWQCGRPTALDIAGADSEHEFEAAFEDMEPASGSTVGGQSASDSFGVFQEAPPEQEEQASQAPSSNAMAGRPLPDSWDAGLGSSDDDSDEEQQDDASGVGSSNRDGQGAEEQVIDALVAATAVLSVEDTAHLASASAAGAASSSAGSGAAGRGSSDGGAAAEGSGAAEGNAADASSSREGSWTATALEGPVAASVQAT